MSARHVGALVVFESAVGVYYRGDIRGVRDFDDGTHYLVDPREPWIIWCEWVPAAKVLDRMPLGIPFKTGHFHTCYECRGHIVPGNTVLLVTGPGTPHDPWRVAPGLSTDYKNQTQIIHASCEGVFRAH